MSTVMEPAPVEDRLDAPRVSGRWTRETSIDELVDHHLCGQVGRSRTPTDVVIRGVGQW